MRFLLIVVVAISLLLSAPRAAEANGSGADFMMMIIGGTLAPGKLVFLGFDIAYLAKQERPSTKYSVAELLVNLPQALAGWLFAYEFFSSSASDGSYLGRLAAGFAIPPTVLVLHAVVALAWPSEPAPRRRQWTLAPLMVNGAGGGVAVAGRF